MPRSTRSAKLETRTARLRLPVAKKPIFVKVAPGINLGYRRNRAAGTWVARISDGKGSNWTKAIGAADDFEDADGNAILDVWQAQEKARQIARISKGGEADTAKPVSLKQALDRYEKDLKVRGGDNLNVTRLRAHLTDRLLDKPVGLLTSGELRKWRDGLVATRAKTKRRPKEALKPPRLLAPATINRTCAALKAMLNLAAINDERITNRRAWEIGLAAIPDAEEARNVILTEAVVRAIITEARRQSFEFGLLIEVAAVTGARVSQLARLEVRDLLPDGKSPRLMMPSSKKGKGKKVIMRRPVPIPVSLAQKLGTLATDRPSNAPLLITPGGDPWQKSDQRLPFARCVEAAGEKSSDVTMYALRHTNVVRQLLAGVPARVVAVNHDTSIVMLERTYSRYIGDHADSLARSAMLDISESEVVKLPQRAMAG